MRTARAPSQKYLDPETLGKLGNLELIARVAVEGFYSGLHPSPFHGFSVEYSDHRQYEPGDELRFLDWKVYGRSDKLYIKRFQQETNVPVYLLLDSSRSMSYRGGAEISKLDYGSFLAASLAYLMLNQGDSVSLITFSDQILQKIPARSRRTHLHTILKTLAHNKPEGRTSLAEVLHTVAETTHRRGMVILISDLLDTQEEIEKGLSHLRFLNHDVILFQTLDPQELNLEFDGLVEFRDLESDRIVKAAPESIRQRFQDRVRAYLEQVEKATGQMGADYELLDTSKPLNQALLAYLSRRRKMM